MPSRDLESNHAELVQNQDCEADSDHLGAIDLSQDLRETLDNAALVDRDKDPDEKGAVGKRGSRGQLFVEFRVQVG